MLNGVEVRVLFWAPQNCRVEDWSSALCCFWRQLWGIPRISAKKKFRGRSPPHLGLDFFIAEIQSTAVTGTRDTFATMILRRLLSHHDFMWKYARQGIWSRPAFIFLMFAMFTVTLLGSAAMFACERGLNPKMNTYFDALYFSVTLLSTVGLGDIAPVTHAGKIVSMVLMLTGTMLFVSFTAVVSSVLLELEVEHLQERIDRRKHKRDAP